jgi:hypothetical protein
MGRNISIRRRSTQAAGWSVGNLPGGRSAGAGGGRRTGKTAMSSSRLPCRFQKR